MTNRQFRFSIVILLGSAALLVWLGRSTNADLYLADLMFDAGLGEFPLRDVWFFDEFMHHTMKALMIGVGLAPAAALLADALRGGRLLEARTRRALAVVVGSAVLVPLAISSMKALSIHHCPWSLSRYGGFAPYLRIFDSLPAGVSAGHCFPAGHASSALWLPALATFWLPERSMKAAVIFVVGLIPGLALGLAQQARGAHFLTHTLWSAWVAAAIVVVLMKALPTEVAGAGTICKRHRARQSDGPLAH